MSDATTISSRALSADSLVTTALDHAPEDRDGFLVMACGDDAALLAEVRGRLAERESLPSWTHDISTKEGPTVRVSPPVAAAEQDRIERYKLLQKIGEGGFGVVWMAEQTEPVSRRVALKIIKLGMDTREVIARFEQERQALAMMDHPHIAKVLDAGATDKGRPFFVMELVKGIPITEYCDEARLGTRERLQLFGDVCSAINHAHQKGIIHRDIKPSNVMVTLHGDQPVVKVIDFGIAKATQGKLTDKTLFTRFEQFIGTPVYMSPEQASLSGLDIDTRSDIYALGIMLYELVVGAPPFDGRTLEKAGYDEMRRIIRETDPPKPSSRLSTVRGDERTRLAWARQIDPTRLHRLVDPDLDWIIMKAIDKDRARRYETASAFAQDIRHFLADEPVSATPPSVGYQFRKFARRNRAALRVATGIAAVLILATLISTYQAVRATREAVRAERAERRMATERNAKDQARKEAEGVARFLIGVFQSPDPTRDGREIKVVELLDKAVKRLEIELAAQPAQRAALQATLGRTYGSLGLYPQASALAEKAHAYHLSAAGPTDPKSIAARHRLASSYLTARRKPEALATAKDLLALSRQVFGPEAPDTIAAMAILTHAYLMNEGIVGEGRQLAEETLALSRKVHGPEHPETLKANTTLAKIVGASSLLEDVTLRQADLEKRRQERGPEHPSTLTAMGDLAESYSRADCHEEANQLYEERLALSRQALGSGHPKTLAALGGLASGYVKAGRHTEAVPLGEELLTSSRKVYGPSHPDTLKAMDKLSTAYDLVHRRAEALQLREEVLASRLTVLGPTHPATLKSINDRADSAADLLMSEGRRQEALDLLVATSVQSPEVSQLAPKVAALQAWFGQEGDFNRTRLRMLTWAAGTKDDAVANRVAKLACLRPMTDPRQAETVLALARHAVRLAGGKYQLTVGMAKYRSGHHEEADAMLAALVSEQSTEPGLSEIMRHTVRFYRVMTLVHRGQLEAARVLFDATELEMRPLPADELNPLADVPGHDHNHVILWLAYKEAQALLTAPTSPKTDILPRP